LPHGQADAEELFDMNYFLRLFILPVLLTMPVTASAANIAGSGSGLLGSNDSTIADAGFSHVNAGVLANIRDGNLTTRVDSYQTGQAARVYGLVGIFWPSARTEVVKSLSLTMATFQDGGWFGIQDSPLSGQALTAGMLVAPVVQVSVDLLTWTTVPATMNYATVANGHAIGSSSGPTSFTFNITLPIWQTGMRGIRVLGQSGGWGDGNGFIGVFEMGVEADVITDTDSDGMHDPWETVNGLVVGTNDAALDAEGDGLSNVLEFRWNTNPQLADSDGDSLTDGAEHTTHGTFPNAADTDGDGLSDSTEINIHLTNAKLADTDGDGLSDIAEINTHLTLPLNRDTDGDGFRDGAEISLGTNALSAASRIANIARGGTAVLGSGTNTANALGATASLNDGNLLTRAMTTTTNTALPVASYAGIVWDAPWPQPVARLEIEVATLSNGGWFSSMASGPLPGAALTASHITAAPALQTTTDGVNWVAVPVGDYTTDYITRLTGHNIGGGGQPEATRRSAVFTLNTPVAGLRGIRVHGNARVFLGVHEISVCDGTTAADTDGDGLTNVSEIVEGTDAVHQDTDGDAVLDGAEVNTLLTDPLLADTDDDYFPDGIEVAKGTNPLLDASNPGNISLIGGGVIGIVTGTGAPNVTPTIAGTAVVFAGTVGNIVDGDVTTRVDSYNGNEGTVDNFAGVQWASRVRVKAVKVQFATFVNGGWFGPPGVGPTAGGALTGAHLTEPIVQTTHNGGATWQQVPVISNYVATLTGHVIAGASNIPTRTPEATFTLLTSASGINGIRLIGPQGGNAQPFIAIFDITVVPEYERETTGVNFPWVTVGNPGNVPHVSGLGAVDYTFDISSHETTIAQYCKFLNGVAASDPHGLYTTSLATNANIVGIYRDGVSGSYEYHVMGDGRRPIALVSWQDAARFVNWLQNGQGSATTETGVYDLTQPVHITLAQTRAAGAFYALPSPDEWFKAAYHDVTINTGDHYWNFAIRADTLVNNSVSANYFDVDYAATQYSLAFYNCLLPAGHYSSVPSAYGTFDQTGSVLEWIEGDTGDRRFSRGGSWFSTSPSTQLAAGSFENRISTEKVPTTGFRVVRPPVAPIMFDSAPAFGKTTAYAGSFTQGEGSSPGPNYVPNNFTNFVSQFQSYSGSGGAASESDVIISPTIANSARGVVTTGKLSLRAANTAPNNLNFYEGIASAGWEDTFLVNVPGMGGQTAYLLCRFAVQTKLIAHPDAGSAALQFKVLTDGAVFSNTEPGANFGTATGNSTNRLQWQHLNYGPDPLEKNVAETITYSIPVVIGQRIRIQCYGLARAGLRAIISGNADSSSASVCASVKWEGIGGLVNAGGTPISGYIVQTSSMLPYATPLPPILVGLPITSNAVGANLLLTWKSSGCGTYQLDKSPDLLNWTSIAIPTSGNVTSYLHVPAVGETRHFFRVWEEL
jgi:formylglycine-generating enzyme required for sulfatase activity